MNLKEMANYLTEIYGSNTIADLLNEGGANIWTKASFKKWLGNDANPSLDKNQIQALRALIPPVKVTPDNAAFRFVDLFAGIGGIRKGFEMIGGLCVFTSEWDSQARRTYQANYNCSPECDWHTFNHDIRDITLSRTDATVYEADEMIRRSVPEHEILLAGFPCQPFSIAGISKKRSLGRATGFEDKTQGTLFFDTARIIRARRPLVFVLENVKNLKKHDGGRTYDKIVSTLTEELGYTIADLEYSGPSDPKIIDGRHFVPQHRERIVLVGFRNDTGLADGFSLKNICCRYPSKQMVLGDILESKPDGRYILSIGLWKYLYEYAKKQKAKGNGFGYGLVEKSSVTRTLSARYYKDGAEILVDRGWDFSKGFDDPYNLARIPRRLTPLECSRLMGFNSPHGDSFKIPVSDKCAYKQFGNSVVVPVFEAIAELIYDHIKQYLDQHDIKRRIFEWYRSRATINTTKDRVPKDI